MIRTIPLTVLFVGLLLGCSIQKNNILHWSAKKGQVVTYQAVMAEFPTDKRLSMSALELSEAAYTRQTDLTDASTVEIPSIYFKAADELASLPLPTDMPLIGTVTTKSSNVLEAKFIGAPARSFIGSQTKAGSREHQLRQLRTDSIQLLAEIDPSGNLISFYLNYKQKNVVSLFFKLPNMPVAVGDSWDIPVQLLSTGNGYIVNKKQRFARAILLAIAKNKHGDMIAKILYIVHEYVEGIYQYKVALDSDGRPFSLGSGYIGYGELVINKGYWLRHIGQMTVKGTGHAPINVKKLQAMVFQEVK